MRIAPRSTRRTASTQPLIDKENRTDRESTVPKRARHRLSTTELARLEDVFGKHTHPSRQQKRELATELKMDYKTVTIWFQNKRQTTKRGQPLVDKTKQTRADSCLRTVSSPSLNATLNTPDATTTPPDAKRLQDSSGTSLEDSSNTTMSSAAEAIKPLLDASNALTPRVRERAESVEQDVDGDVTHHSLSLSLSETVPFQHDQTVEHKQTKATRSSTWKRMRTLEWACERLAKRRKLCRGGGYTRLGSEESQDGHGDPGDARMDSALSLLSLASSVQGGPSKDVIRGASLLLGFKHSWSRKQ